MGQVRAGTRPESQRRGGAGSDWDVSGSSGEGRGGCGVGAGGGVSENLPLHGELNPVPRTRQWCLVYSAGTWTWVAQSGRGWKGRSGGGSRTSLGRDRRRGQGGGSHAGRVPRHGGAQDAVDRAGTP